MSKPAPPPCDCPLAGYCERHQKHKSAHLHMLCQTRDDYRAKWDRDVRPESLIKAVAMLTAVDKTIRDGARTKATKRVLPFLKCIHRGDQVGLVEKCGCSSGDVPIHYCGLLERDVLLRKVGQRPHVKPFLEYPVCQACELVAIADLNRDQGAAIGNAVADAPPPETDAPALAIVAEVDGAGTQIGDMKANARSIPRAFYPSVGAPGEADAEQGDGED